MADKKTSKSFILGIATDLLLIKSVVKAHVRKTRGGKVVQVKEYSDIRKKKTGKEKGLPKGTEVVFRPKGAARARRGVIVGAKAENYHIKGKRGNEGQVINYILPKSQVISLKAFQEKGKKDTRYTKGDKISAHRVLTSEESLKRSEKGMKRLGMTEEDILTNDRIKGYIINRVHRLAKQNNMDTSFDPSGEFIRVHDDDYADMVSEYAIGMLNALRREAAQTPDKDIQEFKDHLAGKRDKSRIFVSMSREGKNSALQVVNTQNKRRREHIDIQSGEEDPEARRNLAALSSAPEHERFALPPKEKAIEKFLSRIPSTDADLISMKFGLGDNEPHTNEQIAEKLKERGTKYQEEYAWTRNNVADAVKGALVKMRDLGGIEDLQDYMKSMREALDLRKSVSSGHKTVCVDFDGVIADYSKGFQGNDVFGEVLPGAVEAMQKLTEFGFMIIVFTTREDTPALRAYLANNEISYHFININPNQPEGTNPGKPIADIYLDDRAVRFTSWRHAVEQIWSVTFKGLFGDMVDRLRGIEKSESTHGHEHYNNAYHLYLGKDGTYCLRKSLAEKGIPLLLPKGAELEKTCSSEQKRKALILAPKVFLLKKSYNKMSKIETLKNEWLQEIARYCRVDKFVDIKEDWGQGDDHGNSEIGVAFNLYTDRYKYSVRAIDRSNYISTSKDTDGYLGCVCSARKPEAGEDRNRGNDLADGPFTKKTWDKIKNDIISMELVELRKSMAARVFLLKKSSSLPREESTIIEKFKKLDTPDVAENGYGFFVKWADGRGLLGLKKKADAIIFAEQGNKEVVSMVYRKREKGNVVHSTFKPEKKKSVVGKTRFLTFKDIEGFRDEKGRSGVVGVSQKTLKEASKRIKKSEVVQCTFPFLN